MKTKTKLIIGIILFIISYIIWEIFDMNQIIDYAKTNEYARLHLKEDIIYNLFKIDTLGIILSIIVTLIYLWNLFLSYIYSKLKNKFHKVLFFIIPIVLYFMIYGIISTIISNMEGWNGLGLGIIMIITFLIIFLFHIIFGISYLIKKIKERKNIYG